MTNYIKELRKLVGTRPIIGVGATVIVRNEHGAILLQKRSDTLTWGLPGGHLELGEDLQQAARRELLEETGLTAEQLVLLDVLSGPEYFFVYPNGDQMHTVIVLYEATRVQGNLRTSAGESVELKYFTLDALPPLESRTANIIKKHELIVFKACDYQQSPERSRLVTEQFKVHDQQFWLALDELLAQAKIIIDRPRGSRHPRFPEILYQVDYGYLEGTSSMDGGGIDVWRGTAKNQSVDAIICNLDLLKKDSEIKLLVGCTQEEKQIIYKFHNHKDFLRGLCISRK